MQTIFYNGLIPEFSQSLNIARKKLLSPASGISIAVIASKSIPLNIFQLLRQVSLFLAGGMMNLALTDRNALSLAFIADEGVIAFD
jgi:hypothetical protein